MTQQIEQFHREGEPFAMQHLGTDDELVKVWSGILRSLSPTDRSKLVTPEELVEWLTPEQRAELATLLQKQEKKPRKPKKKRK